MIELKDVGFLLANIPSAIRLYRAIVGLKPPHIGKEITGVCLEGDTELRLQKTIELFKKGKIHRIIVSGNVPLNKNEDQLPASEMKLRMLDASIPENVIDVEQRSEHTGHQATYVLNLAKEKGYTDLLLVTSGYHLVRTYLTFVKELEREKLVIQIYGCPAGNFLSWFQKSKSEEQSFRWLTFIAELIKIRNYADVASMDDGWKYIQGLKNQLLS